MGNGEDAISVLPTVPSDRVFAAVEGCIVGTAVGDALGLPREGLSPGRSLRLFGPLLSHHLLLRRGLVSDDTEHTCMVAQALIASACDPEAFQRDLARRITRWFWLLPAGVGLATLRACLKLGVGISPAKSGVYSAGNGPSMRSALLGIVARDLEHLYALVHASTQITHCDPRAMHAAFAVALAARFSASRQDVRPDAYLRALKSSLGNEAQQFTDLAARVAESLEQPTSVFARELGLEKGVTGYALHTVPVCLHAWLRSPRDYRQALCGAIECGGDADTTGAIIGAIVGAGVGIAGIPEEWVRGMADWPRTIPWMTRLAAQLASGRGPVPELASSLVLLRNVVFLGIVLAHGFRRLLPPY